MNHTIIYALSGLISFSIIIGLPILLIIKAIKKSSKRNYELRKYQAETERIKAEAMRDKANRE